MKTKYNVFFYIEPKPGFVTKKDYDATWDLFKKNKIVGEKTVNSFGLMKDGYDNNCDIYRIAKFKFKPRDIELTMPEMIDSINPYESRENEEIIRKGEELLSIISRSDPSASILPWNIYSQFPYIESMEIHTPAGRQSLHFHTEDDIKFGVIQLYKPKKEKFYYDVDLLKDYLFDFWINDSTKEKPIDKGFIKNFITDLKKRKAKKLSDLYSKLIKDPDSIDSFPKILK